MTGDRLRTATRDTLREVAKNLAGKVDANANGTPLAGKHISKIKVDTSGEDATVSIFGHPLARIFEGGTYIAQPNGGRLVYNRNGAALSTPANRGNIKGYYFLGQAFEEYGEQMHADFLRIFTQNIKL